MLDSNQRHAFFTCTVLAKQCLQPLGQCSKEMSALRHLWEEHPALRQSKLGIFPSPPLCRPAKPKSYPQEKVFPADIARPWNRTTEEAGGEVKNPPLRSNCFRQSSRACLSFRVSTGIKANTYAPERNRTSIYGLGNRRAVRCTTGAG